MPEDEKPSVAEVLIQAVARRALGFLKRYVERAVRRAIRMAGIYVLGLVIALVGVVFLATGIAKWLETMFQSWQAWAIVGIVLLLWGGTVLATASFFASKN